MTFEELNLKKSFKKNVAEEGYTEMTTIQSKTYSVVLSGRDIMGIAQTGTGKTIAYLLPSFHLWKFSARHEVQILVLVPTRELVVQVLEVAQRLAKDTGLMCVGVFGGAGIQPQAQRIREGADLLVGTPGRILDLALNGYLRMGNVKRLILDEVDEMLEQGFRTQIGRVLDLLPKKRQNLMFSATMTSEIESLAETFFNGPEKIEAAPAGTPVANIHQTMYDVPNFNTKVNLLNHLLTTDESMSRVMVFVSTIALADELFSKIEPVLGEDVDYMHSRRTQSQRFKALQNFRDGKTRVLIATDLIARGIDVAGVSHVVCFDLPTEPEQYVHRIGRTGRVDAEGISIAMLTPGEREQLEKIKDLTGIVPEVIPMPEDVSVSTQLVKSEMPVIRMRNSFTEIDATPGHAFHERAEHNKKVNKRISHKTAMRIKYGKPKTRGPKRK